MSKIKNLTVIAMLTALSYVVMLMVRVPFPAAAFLRYDPQDVFIVIGGFLYGPFAALGMAAVVALVRFLTVSTTGAYGLLMNIVTTCAFVFPASVIYSRHRTIKGAAAGLCAGVLSLLAVAMLWNYIMVPIFTNAPRHVVVNMLIPVFLPFNLLKGVFNMAIVMLIYKRLSVILRKIKMLPEAPEKSSIIMNIIFGLIFAGVTAAMLILAVLEII
jgi:riboflavin transporter FmnP